MAISSISSISNVTSIAKTISSIASISGVSQSSISSIIRISLPLGHMDSASRVSDIATSSSIGSGSHYSRNSSRGCSSNGKGGRGGHLGVSIVVSMVNTSNVVNRSHSIDTSNSVNRSSSMDSSNIVDWSSSLNSSNILNRGHRLHSRNAVNRVDSLNHWSSISSISSISNAIVSSIIRISLPLGHMDSSSRVSNIATSSSIGSGSHYSRDSSRGCSSDGKGGRGGHLSVCNIVMDRVVNNTISMAISSISSISNVTSIAKTISSIASISGVSQSSISSIIRISLPLGHMDSASRVSHIATSSSIGSGSHYSRHSSRGCSSDRKGGGGGHLSVSNMVVPMVDRRSVAIATISTNPSISQAINT